MRTQFVRTVLLVAVCTLILQMMHLSTAQAKDDITGDTHEQAIRQLVATGIMKGYGDGVYKPSAPLTRGNFAQLLTRALHLNYTDKTIVFQDEKNEEILAAAQAGIITGINGNFNPTEQISRQHMAIMLDRALTRYQVPNQVGNHVFLDEALILEVYRPAVKNLAAHKIMNGTPTNKGLIFRPLEPTTRGQAATVIVNTLKAVEGKLPGTPQPEPKPEPEPIPPVEKPQPKPPTPPVSSGDYAVGDIAKNGQFTAERNFTTFAEAQKFLESTTSSTRGITYKGTVQAMTGGVVYSQPTAASSLTNIYTDANLRSAATYIAKDLEMEYVRSTDQYVVVKMAGQLGYIKQENAKLVPWHALSGRSYYTVANGQLYHYVFSPVTNKYGMYNAGKAPSFLKAGQKYYSWDGINFTNESSKTVGSAYQYYQFLPARSTTAYTAEEIDRYIMSMLRDLEKTYPTNSTYKNASTRSKLVGLGKYLKEMEAKHQVNAMMILALAQHESAYGLSVRAVEYNNLFGIRVFDDNPDNTKFPTVESNIDELMKSYFNKNYIPPNASYANGAVFGNKKIGFNVKYASDPYWGAKAAGHYYRADAQMGYKDLKQAYRIGLTTTPGLNVRQAPSASAALAFTYKTAGYPVLIVGSASPAPWLTIKSDELSGREVFVSGNYVKELPVAK